MVAAAAKADLFRDVATGPPAGRGTGAGTAGVSAPHSRHCASRIACAAAARGELRTPLPVGFQIVPCGVPEVGLCL